MKKLLNLFIFILAFAKTFAIQYFVKNGGSDAADGLTDGTAWATVSKVNSMFSGFTAGTIVSFKAGGIYPGNIVATHSGTSVSPIVINSYGTGAKPIISGLTAVTGWTSDGNGVWSKVLSSAPSLFDVKIVTLNNKLQGMGRTPNVGQWWNYEDTGWVNSTTRTIIDNELVANIGANSYVGAQAVIRMNSYVTDISTITAQNGGTITYTIPKSFDLTNDYTSPTKNYSYFLQNDYRTLDQFGEWYWNKSTKTLSMYFGANNPASYIINTSFVTDMVYLGDGGFGTSGTTAYSDITFDGLDIQGGTRNGLYGFNAARIKVQNCNFCNNGNGIFLWA